MTGPVSIRHYLDVPRDAAVERGIDAVFFEASNTRSFADEAARRAFRERWLGRYLRCDPTFAYLALDGTGSVAGYLVGAIDDPARAERFRDIAYFESFRELTPRFPAHLHVNLAPDFRNRGIGTRLIEAFIADARAAGAPGVHVVTTAEAANVRFYERNGFQVAGRTGPESRLLFLARKI